MQKSAASWVAPLAVGVVVLVILVVVAVTATRDDGGLPAADETTLAETSATSGSSSGSSEPAPSSSTPPGVDLSKPVQQAIKDDFPAMVPAEIPPGWTATDAAYTRGQGGPVWALSFQTPEGATVALTQSELPLRQAVSRYLGRKAEQADRVDLRRFGTGYWFVYADGDPLGIAKQLPSTSVVVAAPSTDDAVTLAKMLLTAEDYAMPEAG